MPLLNPLDLPEIRSHLAQFLTRRELDVCCRVSDEWNRSFEPYVWQELRLWVSSDDKQPLVEAIIRRKNLVERMTWQHGTGYVVHTSKAQELLGSVD